MRSGSTCSPSAVHFPAGRSPLPSLRRSALRGPSSLLAMRDVCPRCTRWEVGFPRPSLRWLLLWTLSARMFCVVCTLCQALCGTHSAASGVVCSGASAPCLVGPEICVCSSFDLSTAGGGSSSYQHSSGGEALWYPTCALLVLLTPCLGFAQHLFTVFATFSPSNVHTRFHVAHCTLFLLLGRRPVAFLISPTPIEAFLHHVVFCFPVAN